MQELLCLSRKDSLFIIYLIILESEVRFKSDALKKLALNYTLADLLHLSDVRSHASKLLLCLIQFDVFLFDLLSLIVHLILLLLQLFGLCLQLLLFVSKPGPLDFVLAVCFLDFSTHFFDTLHFMAKSAVLFNKVLLEFSHFLDGRYKRILNLFLYWVIYKIILWPTCRAVGLLGGL